MAFLCDNILWMVTAKARTGLRSGLLLFSCGIVTFCFVILLVFTRPGNYVRVCQLWVIVGDFAVANEEAYVSYSGKFCFSLPLCFEYSHDLHAIKNVEIVNRARAFCFSVFAEL